MPAARMADPDADIHSLIQTSAAPTDGLTAATSQRSALRWWGPVIVFVGDKHIGATRTRIMFYRAVRQPVNAD